MRVALTAILLSAAAAFSQSAGPSQSEKIFSERIAPLLRANCSQCHGTGSPAGGLSLAALSSVLSGGKHGPAIEPGNSNAYASSLTQLPQPKKTDNSRADWKAPRSIPGAGIPGIVEMVSAAITDPKR
jgi:hypothetical protein